MTRIERDVLGITVRVAVAGSAGALRSTRTCYERFRRWTKAGVWDQIMDAIADAYDDDVGIIDDTSALVYHSAATLKKPG